MKTLTVLLLLLPVLASADIETELANLLSDCSGFWEFFAITDDAQGNAASAKQMRERRNGAAVAAQYLLALEYEDRTGKKKALKEFADYVTARSEPMKTALLAHMEREEFDRIETEFNKCDAALEIQDKLIQAVRSKAYRN